MADLEEIDAQLRATIYHELGHAFVALSFGYPVYVDVVHRPGERRAVCITPSAEYAPLVPTVLKRLGGGMGEFLTVDEYPTAEKLCGWLLEPERHDQGMNTDLETLRQDIRADLGDGPDFRDNGEEALEERVREYVRFAANYAELVLYKAPWRGAFEGLARALAEKKALLMCMRSGKLRVYDTPPLNDRDVQGLWLWAHSQTESMLIRREGVA